MWLFPVCLYVVLLPTFFQLDLSVCLTPRQQGQWHCPVIVLTACVPVGWRRVMRVFHYGLDGWVRLADADRQQMCKVGGWFVKGSTASRRRWRAMPGGGKLRRGRLSVIVHRCHRKVKVSSNTVSEQLFHINSRTLSKVYKPYFYFRFMQKKMSSNDTLDLPDLIFLFLSFWFSHKLALSAFLTCLSFPLLKHNGSHRVGSETLQSGWGPARVAPRSPASARSALSLNTSID